MDMKGEYRIAAPRQKVWDALNDVDVLKQCIPGCETITKTSDTDMTATVRAKVGPVSARFGGKVTISDRDPPNGYKITGEGTGGPAGFAKGGATVKLADDGDGTLLSYVVDANVGGKLAQIGSRLIDATARQMAENFFAKFASVVAASAAAAPAATAPAPAAAPTAQPAPAAQPTPAAPTAPATAPAGEAPVEEPVRVAELPPRPAPDVELPPPAQTPPLEGKRLSPAIWVTGLAVIVIILLYFFTR